MEPAVLTEVQGEDPTEIVQALYIDISGTAGSRTASNGREPSTINAASTALPGQVLGAERQ